MAWLQLLRALGILLLASCTEVPVREPPAPPRPVVVAPGKSIAPGTVLGRNDDMVVYLPRPGETWADIARRHLGDEKRAWWLAHINQSAAPIAGEPVLVALHPDPAFGLDSKAYQLVPILCYHRLGARKSKMVVTPKQFEAQMVALRDNGYQVITLAAFLDFLDGRQPLPPRAVVITFDDGYASTYTEAYPILRRLDFPATVFLYTDFIGAGDALTWAQMDEMRRSGLIDFQAHSKSHANLAKREAGESEARYLTRLRAELTVPKASIERRLGHAVAHFAYPFGAGNAVVAREAQAQGYVAAYTVDAAGNAFFAFRHGIHRTMIYGEDDIRDFLSKLDVSQPLQNE